MGKNTAKGATFIYSVGTMAHFSFKGRGRYLLVRGGSMHCLCRLYKKGVLHTQAEIFLIYMTVHLCAFIYLLVLLLFLQSFHSFRCNAPLATAPKRAGHLDASGRALVPRPARL